jgi:ElaB/YqjD/DUF883 family membrane-anchored ribosome-binding protein
VNENQTPAQIAARALRAEASHQREIARLTRLLNETEAALVEASMTAAPANTELRSEIKHALNRASAENASDTPDHVLADYLLACLAAFDAATLARSTWYGHHSQIEYATTPPPADPGSAS